MRVHQAVAHSGPVIEAMIQIADPRLFLVVARAQRGIEGRNRLLDRRPFPLAVLILGHAGLQASLVLVRARIADVLIAVGLGKEHAQADTARRLGIRRIEALGARNGGSQVDNVLERRLRVLRIGGRRLHDAEEIGILIEQRLVVGIEIRRRNSEFVGPADLGRQRVGEILVRAHHGVACKIERLSRQVRQRLLRIDLRAPLAQDRLEVVDRIVVRVERIRLRLRECGRLSLRGGNEAEIADVGRDERATAPAIASMAPETGGENKSPSARAAARAAAGAAGATAPAMRAPAVAPGAAIKPRAVSDLSDGAAA